MSVENSLFTFINTAVLAADPSSALFGVKVYEEAHDAVESVTGIRIGQSKYDLAPNPGGLTMGEFDAIIEVVVFTAVTGSFFNREAARNSTKDIIVELALLFVNDPSIGGAVRDSRFLHATLDWDSQDGVPFSVGCLPFVYNETGQQLSGNY